VAIGWVSLRASLLTLSSRCHLGEPRVSPQFRPSLYLVCTGGSRRTSDALSGYGEPQEVLVEDRVVRLRCVPVSFRGVHSGSSPDLGGGETYAIVAEDAACVPALLPPESPSRQSPWLRRERVAELRIDRSSECNRLVS
jgi:hypothetical protein